MPSENETLGERLDKISKGIRNQEIRKNFPSWKIPHELFQKLLNGKFDKNE